MVLKQLKLKPWCIVSTIIYCFKKVGEGGGGGGGRGLSPLLE